MIFAKNRKGQSSVEFVLIAGVMFLIFIGMFVVLQGRITGAYKNKIYVMLDGFGNLLSTEIRLAYSAKGDYARVFDLPESIDNYDYNISINNMNEISIRVEDIDYLVFLDQNISGSIKKGQNIIRKIRDNISINEVIEESPIPPDLCSEGTGSDDARCGVIDCSGWYVKQGVEGPMDTQTCYNKQDFTNNRCEDVMDCVDANSSDCNAQSDDVLQYSCEVCKYIAASNCTGTILGDCTNYPLGTSCGVNKECNGNGQCISIGSSFFIIKNIAGQNITKMDDLGNIILKGSCTATSGGACTPPVDSFVIKDSGGVVVAYIDLNGNLCIKDANCNDNDVNCNNPGTNSFVIKDDAGTVVIYINEIGNLCLIGSLTPGGNP